MSCTAGEIYDRAIHLMDGQRDSDGSTVFSETKDYQVRACPLLSTLLNEVYPYSDTYAQALALTEPGKRPVLPPVTALTDPVPLDDYLCMSVLPVGLAALFLREENRVSYESFWADYLNRLNRARQTLPVSGGEEQIEDLYGGIEHGKYGKWL